MDKINDLADLLHALSKIKREDFSYNIIKNKHLHTTEAVEKVYHTSYKDMLVDITYLHKYADEQLDELYTLTFSKNNNVCLDVQFINKNFSPNNNYVFKLLHNDNIEIIDKTEAEKLLKNIDFVSFLAQEEKNIQQKIQTFADNDYIHQNDLADNLIENLPERHEPLDYHLFLKNIYDFSVSSSFDDLFLARNYSEQMSLRTMHTHFQDFEVSHCVKTIPNVLLVTNQVIHFINVEKNIDFSLDICVKTDMTPVITLVVEDKKINNPEVIKSVIEKSNMSEYIENNLLLVKHLEKARMLQSEIHDFLSNNKSQEQYLNDSIIINNQTTQISLNEHNQLHNEEGAAIHTKNQQYWFNNGYPYIPELEKNAIYQQNRVDKNKTHSFIKSLRDKFFSNKSTNCVNHNL